MANQILQMFTTKSSFCILYPRIQKQMFSTRSSACFTRKPSACFARFLCTHKAKQTLPTATATATPSPPHRRMDLAIPARPTNESPSISDLYDSWFMKFGNKCGFEYPIEWRLKIFEENYEFVKHHNATHPSSPIDLDEYAHLSEFEYPARYFNPPTSEYLSLSDFFERWCRKHGKKYTSEQERERRLKIFEEACKFVIETNSNHRCCVNLGNAADLTFDEMIYECSYESMKKRADLAKKRADLAKESDPPSSSVDV